MNLQTLIEQTHKTRSPGYWQAAHVVPTPAGNVRCIIDYLHGAAHKPGSHQSVRFELNGARIARAKLVSILKC